MSCAGGTDQHQKPSLVITESISVSHLSSRVSDAVLKSGGCRLQVPRNEGSVGDIELLIVRIVVVAHSMLPQDVRQWGGEKGT